jgi:transposase
MYPFLKKLFADGGYQGPDFQKALAKILRLSSKLKSSSAPIGRKDSWCFHARWVVERTFAWLNRCRRLAKAISAPAMPASRSETPRPGGIV